MADLCADVHAVSDDGTSAVDMAAKSSQEIRRFLEQELGVQKGSGVTGRGRRKYYIMIAIALNTSVENASLFVLGAVK